MPWKDPEVARIKQAEYRARNREKLARRARERYAENPRHRLESNRLGRLKWKYGITMSERDAMLRTQDGRCAICQTDTPPTASGWHVDHCHNAKKVRGILCQHCNNMLGMSKDDPSVLSRAIKYLGGNND